MIRALTITAPQALPPYPLPALLATAVLGGVVMGLALVPSRADEMVTHQE